MNEKVELRLPWCLFDLKSQSVSEWTYSAVFDWYCMLIASMHTFNVFRGFKKRIFFSWSLPFNRYCLIVFFFHHTIYKMRQQAIAMTVFIQINVPFFLSINFFVQHFFMSQLLSTTVWEKVVQLKREKGRECVARKKNRKKKKAIFMWWKIPSFSFIILNFK